MLTPIVCASPPFSGLHLVHAHARPSCFLRGAKEEEGRQRLVSYHTTLTPLDGMCVVILSVYHTGIYHVITARWYVCCNCISVPYHTTLSPLDGMCVVIVSVYHTIPLYHRLMVCLLLLYQCTIPLSQLNGVFVVIVSVSHTILLYHRLMVCVLLLYQCPIPYHIVTVRWYVCCYCISVPYHTTLSPLDGMFVVIVSVSHTIPLYHR